MSVPTQIPRRTAALTVLLLCSACTDPVQPAQVHALKKSDLTPAEIKYGRGPKRDRTVTYQADVVIVEGGAGIIRSQGPDPLTWTIDAHAGHAGDIAVGKIAFVTGRCVGRVLKARRDGDNLNLVLGPVELTEIFRKLDISFDQPIDLTQAVPYQSPELPRLKFPVEGPDSDPPAWAATSGLPGYLRPMAYEPVSPGIPQRLSVGFQTRQLNDKDGIGMELRHESDGVRLIAQAQLRISAPRLEFHIGIDDGKILDARLILHNAAGIRLAFDSAVSEAFSGNINWYLPAGGSSIPFSGNSPLAVNIRQDIWVETAFSAKQSVFSAGADYDLNADIGFTFQNGSFSFIGPKGVSVRKSLMNNMTGVSVGARGLILSHALTITGGLGVWEFTTGPSFSLGTSVGASMGSNIGIVECKGAALAVNLRAGVGWTIPRVVAKFVNFFLRIVKVREIPDHGGLYTPWRNLFTQHDQTRAPICGGAGS